MIKRIIARNLPLFAFLLILLVVFRQIFLKGYIVGPFDFLVGFFDPYFAISWPEKIASMALHYKNFLMSDVVVVILPIKLLLINLIKDSQLPLWNPYNLAWSPLLANVQSAVLYPLNLLYFFLNASTAYSIYVLLQPILAFAFMFVFLRELKLTKVAAFFGSLSFSLSSFMIVWITWGTIGHSWLWLPLILFLIIRFVNNNDRMAQFFLPIVLALSFFAGHTQTAIMVWGTSFAFSLYYILIRDKRSLTITVLFLFFIALLITSIQLLPAFEMYRESTRELLATESFYKDQTLYLSSYLQAFSPDFFGNPVTRNWWGKINYAESAIYFGTTAFYLALFYLFSLKEKKDKIIYFFLSLGLMGILLSTQNLFSSIIFYLKIPLISSSTFSRYSALFIFSAVILASKGIDSLSFLIREKKFVVFYRFNLITVFLIVLYWLLILNEKILPAKFAENIGIIKRNSIFPSIIIFFAIVLSSFFWFFNRIKQSFFKKRLLKILPFIFIFLLLVELIRFTSKYIPVSPRDFFYPNHALLEKLQLLTTEDRYIGYLPANINAIYGIRGVEGGEPLYNRKLGELASLGKDGKIHLQDRAGISFPDGIFKDRIMDLMSVRFFVDKQDNFRNSWIDNHQKDNKAYDKRFRQIWTDGIFKIYENNFVLPRHHLFFETETIDNKSKILKKLIDPSFDYKKIALISGRQNLKLQGKGNGTIKILDDKVNTQRYEINTSRPVLFVVTDTFYPGWQAYLDGNKGKIILANYAFRAVFVPAGKHIVVFQYQPESFRNGSFLTMIGIFFIVIYVKLQRSLKLKS